MGNYFSSYKDHFLMKENNNVISPTALICPVKTNKMESRITAQPKLSRLPHIFTTEITSESYYREDSLSLKTFTWNKLRELQQFSKAICGKRIDTHCQQNITEPPTEDEKTNSSARSYKIQQHLCFDLATCDRVLGRVNSHLNCIYSPAKHIETPLLCFNFTALNMVDLNTCLNTKDTAQYLENYSFDSNFCMETIKQVNATCFFVDINKPLERQKLKPEHKFCSIKDKWPSDSDGESLCSSKYDESENCDGFIVFDEDEFVENRFCGFQISWNSERCYPECGTGKSLVSHTTNLDKLYSVECENNSKIAGDCRKTPRKVRFETDENLTVVHHMKHWDFAYRDARKGPWELAAVDRFRFCRRIQDLDSIITPCLEKKLLTIRNVNK